MKGRFAPHVLEKQGQFFRCLLTFVPLVIAGFLAYALATTEQLHEVLLRTFEGTPGWDMFGLVVFAILCLLFGSWDYRLSTAIKDREYASHANPYLDRVLGGLIVGKAMVVAALPFVGLIWGLRAAWLIQSVKGGKAATIAQDPAFKDFAAPIVIGAQLGRYSMMMLLAVALLLTVVGTVFWTHRRRVRILGSVLAIILALGVLALLGAWLVPKAFVSLASSMGSFPVFTLIAMSALTVLFAITLEFFTAEQRPLVGLAGAAAILVTLLFVFWLGQPRETLALSRSAAKPARAETRLDLVPAFDRWVARRELGRNASRREPVFIFAMPGGGIYAASAAATLLARLQDRCPAFARHVFAVSAVSGGAVGSAIFNSVLTALPSSSDRRCEALSAPVPAANDGKATTLTELVRQVIIADHLAPVGAFFVPDFLRKLPAVFSLPAHSSFDRADALEASILRAIGNLEINGRPLNAFDRASLPYWKHWSPDGGGPALILNTTWVETGNRAAFAPFPLNRIGGDTLYSFEDAPFADNALVEDMSTLQAAIVSARFPGTSPAWQLPGNQIEFRPRGEDKKKTEKRTWNFVDGGYTDNSGASTAFAIYKTLLDHIKKENLPLELRLIVLSEEELSDRSPPDGTRFTDTVAPITAILNLRKSGLPSVLATQLPSNQSATREDERRWTARAGSSPILVMRLNQDAFPLTLGWTISEYRNSTIRLQLGEPELCKTHGVEDDQAKDTILGNSCVQYEIFRLLGAKLPQIAPSR